MKSENKIVREVIKCIVSEATSLLRQVKSHFPIMDHAALLFVRYAITSLSNRFSLVHVPTDSSYLYF